MGHVRLGTLPKTRPWRGVVALLAGGGAASAVAEAAASAGIDGLAQAKDDSGVVRALWLLVQLPSAGKDPDLAEALRARGVDIEGAPSLLGLTSAISAALDSSALRGGSSDVGEMAALAAVETVTSFVGARVPSLFESTASDLQSALRGLATEKQFGAFARAFFARFSERYLTYYLSRELSAHVGRGERFEHIDDHRAFNAALRLHCHEAARIVEVFAGEWFSKYTWTRQLSRDTTRRFAAVAFKKLNAELQRRGESSSRGG